MIDMGVLPVAQLTCVWKARENESFKCVDFGCSINDVFVLLSFIVPNVDSNVLASGSSFLAQ